MLKIFMKKKELPNWTDITVSPIIGKALGFKSKASSFYLITDKESSVDLSYAELIDDDETKAAFHKNKPLFRGVYCSPGVENISDITADLQKYCDLTGMPGFVKLNDKEYNLLPNNVKNLKKEHTA